MWKDLHGGKCPRGGGGMSTIHTNYGMVFFCCTILYTFIVVNADMRLLAQSL